jgi:hypothetical protein
MCFLASHRECQKRFIDWLSILIVNEHCASRVGAVIVEDAAPVLRPPGAPRPPRLVSAQEVEQLMAENGIHGTHYPD